MFRELIGTKIQKITERQDWNRAEKWNDLKVDYTHDETAVNFRCIEKLSSLVL